MQIYDQKYEWRQHIFREVKHYFIDKIGKFTHHKYEPEYHFRGIAFVLGEMTYLFGFNIGFYRTNTLSQLYEYDTVGANMLIRTNGINEPLRIKFKEFFEKHLKDWTLGSKTSYTGPRGDVGILLPRYKDMYYFSNDQQIIEFFKKSIEQYSQVFKFIKANPEGIFNNVVRANPPWDEFLIDLANQKA